MNDFEYMDLITWKLCKLNRNFCSTSFKANKKYPDEKVPICSRCCIPERKETQLSIKIKHFQDAVAAGDT